MSFSFGIPFIPFYIQELGITDTARINVYTAVLSAVPAITMAVMAPVWGIVSDRYGKKLMLMRAMFFAAIIIAGMGLVSNVNQLIVLRLLQGVFTGTITASSALIASGTPEKRLSFALGFLSSSTFIGSSIGPVIGGYLAGSMGYRPSFLIGGAIMMADFLMVLLMVKEAIPDRQPEISTSERYELSINRGFLSRINRGFLSRMPINKKYASDSTKNKKSSNVVILFVPAILSMLAVIFVLRVSRSLFNPYLPLFVQETYKSLSDASRTTGIINGITGLMTALSGLTLCRLGDRFNKASLLILLCTAAILVSVPLGLLNGLVSFTIFYSLFYFVMGGVEPIVLSITVQNTPAERRGTLFGFQGLVGSLGWVISPLIGSLISLKFSINAILFLLPATTLAAMIIIFLFRKHISGNMCESEPNVDNACSLQQMANLQEAITPVAKK